MIYWPVFNPPPPSGNINLMKVYLSRVLLLQGCLLNNSFGKLQMFLFKIRQKNTTVNNLNHVSKL